VVTTMSRIQLFRSALGAITMSCILLSTQAVAQSPALSSESHAIPRKVARARKYDINHIGERGIGGGVNMYSIDRERTLGQQLAASVDRVAKLINQTLVIDYINELGQTIARHSDSELPFTIKVIDSDDMGVFALPGGFLYVDRGLITGLDSEAELASMMAHEIAHVAARHTTRAVTRKRIFKLITTAGMLVGPAGVIVENVGGLGGPLSEKKFDRDA